MDLLAIPDDHEVEIQRWSVDHSCSSAIRILCVAAARLRPTGLWQCAVNHRLLDPSQITLAIEMSHARRLSASHLGK